MTLSMHQFPPLYGRWIADLLGAAPPRETKATCDDCVACAKPDGRIPTAVFALDPDVKCCFYMPRLPNFLVGRILSDDAPGAAAGRRSVEERVNHGPITPLGLDRPPAYQAQVQDYTSALQNSRALRCPHYLEERGGVCGIYAHRDSMCTTYYCQHDRGRVGMAFWRGLRRLLAQVELDLSVWAASQLGIDPVELQRFLLPAGDDDGMHYGKQGGAQQLGRAGPEIWGAWAGRPADYYKAAAELVNPLSWAEVTALCGVPVQVRTAVARSALKDLTTPEIPERLRVGQFAIVTTRVEGLRTVTYSALDAVDLPSELVSLLPRFDGRPTDVILAELAEQYGVEIEPDFLQHLVDWDILVAAE